MRAFTVAERLQEIHKLYPHSSNVSEIEIIKKMKRDFDNLDEYVDSFLEAIPEGATHLRYSEEYQDIEPIRIKGLSIYNLSSQTNEWFLTETLRNFDQLKNIGRKDQMVKYLSMYSDLYMLIGGLEETRAFYKEKVRESKHFFTIDFLDLNVDILKYYLEFLELIE